MDRRAGIAANEQPLRIYEPPTLEDLGTLEQLTMANDPTLNTPEVPFTQIGNSQVV